jgi:hypothetical protein
VRGGPGAGKSALLGLIVCAGHHELRDVLRPLWRDVPGAPPAPIAGLIAAHARQRSAAEVMDAIAAQAGLDAGPHADALGASRAGWTAPSLRSALERKGSRPVVVIDAVDESTEVWAVAELVQILAQPLPERGRSVCRLLVAGRSEAIEAIGGSAAQQAELLVMRLSEIACCGSG